ncbi:sterol desaturase family protein [Anatilimnocola sp. NA78]|uniref:sterol desaturase family protein n=1 Tax=Anatilimnocola sp. NA78 TaxID=3415683 RepID=UPI003CE5027B
MNTVLLEFSAIFAFLLVLGYFVPAGSFYWLYHVRQRDLEPIQSRQPTAAQIKREIQLSVSTVFIFAVMTTGLYQLYKSGHTSIYWNFRDYPIGYFPVSVFLCLVVHDTFFYWTHRFMHWRPVFKYMHLGHHRSVAPTPWAIFAFQPAEAVVQFLCIASLVLFLPLHPLAFLLFLWIDTQVNTAGHTGYEMVPKFISQHPFFRGLNTVTHHDGHHTNMNKNFGSFFNVWDRWMGTLMEDEEIVAANHKPAAAAHKPQRQHDLGEEKRTEAPLPQPSGSHFAGGISKRYARARHH